MSPANQQKYLLTMVDPFTGWTEAFPTSTEKAKQVTKALLTHNMH
jgi:hypothetical protein